MPERVWGPWAWVVVCLSVCDHAGSTSPVLWSAVCYDRQSENVSRVLELGKHVGNRLGESRDWASQASADSQQILVVLGWLCGRSFVESSVLFPIAVVDVCHSPEFS